MKVVLDASLFEPSPPTRTLDLLGLVALAGWMGHRLLSEPDAVERWADSLQRPLGSWLTELLGRHLMDATNLSATTREVTIHAGETDWASARLSVDDAVILLRTPLELLLENERSDWGFLLRLADRGRRAQLENALKIGALQIRQAGGITELKKSVDGLFEGADTQRIRRLQTWVMFDRDVPSGLDRSALEAGGASKDARLACERSEPSDPWRLRSTPLTRRTIESYLPSVVLEKLAAPAHRRAAAKALTKLRAQHPSIADSIHLKEGLQKELPPYFPTSEDQEPEKVRPTLNGADGTDQARRRLIETQLSGRLQWRVPFNEIDAVLRADLLVGFGRKAADLFQNADSSFDPDFPAEFNRTAEAEGTTAAALIESILECL